LAICVFRHEGRILAAEGYDPIKEQLFYRPLGGGIEFGETSREALGREIREELGVEITNLEYLGTVENIFEFAGEPGHEIVLVYDGRLVDERLYQQETLQGYEVEMGEPFTIVWKPLAFFLAKDSPPLYPDGLLELLLAG
jgi:ADP-ribose pyrophosphatase YjhB (NUDIX family)